MKTKLILMAACVALSGCTSFTVTQTDESPNVRKTVTQIRATALFSSSQALAKIKAIQNDKGNSFGSDTLSQQGGTNTVQMIESLTKLLQAIAP